MNFVINKILLVSTTDSRVNLDADHIIKNVDVRKWTLQCIRTFMSTYIDLNKNVVIHKVAVSLLSFTLI